MFFAFFALGVRIRLEDLDPELGGSGVRTCFLIFYYYRYSTDNCLFFSRSRQDSQSSGRPHSAGRGGPQAGQPIGFHRGANRGGGVQRGAGGGGQPHQGFRGRGAGRGGFQPGRLEPAKEKLKFDGDYDFDKANEEFKVRGAVD